METLIESNNKTIRIEDDKLELETNNGSEEFPLTDGDKIDAARALLGEAPPLGERFETPQELAADSSLSEGELRYQAIAALEALQMRVAEIARRTKEQEEKDRIAAIEARKRVRQINAIEKIYLSSQTGRRRIASQVSQNLATDLYDRGVRVPGLDDEDEETPAAS